MGREGGREDSGHKQDAKYFSTPDELVNYV